MARGAVFHNTGKTLNISTENQCRLSVMHILEDLMGQNVLRHRIQCPDQLKVSNGI